MDISIRKKDLEKTLNTLLLCKSIEELESDLKKIFQYFDIDQFAIMTFFDSNLTSSAGFSIPELFHTYPKEWTEHYFRSSYYYHDPLYTLVGIRLPFGWNEKSMTSLTSIQKQLFYEAHDYNIQNGTTIPLVPLHSERTFVTVLNFEFLSAEICQVLTWASQLYCSQKQSLICRKTFRSLTHREQEVLFLKAKGLSIKQIAPILNISEPTINFHLKSIRQKLGVRSSEQTLFWLGTNLGKLSQKAIHSLDVKSSSVSYTQIDNLLNDLFDCPVGHNIY